MEQVGGGVVAHRLLPDFSIDDGINFLPHMDGLPRMDFVRTHALHRRVASADFGDDVARRIVEPSGVADLPAGVGVEGRVIEDDLAFLTGTNLFDALSVADDGQNFAITRLSL